MHYRNPIDKELIEASQAVLRLTSDMMMNAEVAPESSPLLLRLKNAIYNARTEISATEELDNDGVTPIIDPPNSMD